MLGGDVAPLGVDALDPPILDIEIADGAVGKRLELARLLRLVDELARDGLRARYDEARVRVPHRPLDLGLVDVGELLFHLLGADERNVGTKRFARAHLALELLHTLVVVVTRDFHAADARIVADGLVEVGAIRRRIDGHVVMRRHEAKVRGVRGRADVRRNARLVDAHDVVPPALNQVVRHRGTDNPALTDDHDVCSIGKVRHGFDLRLSECWSLLGPLPRGAARPRTAAARPVAGR